MADAATGEWVGKEQALAAFTGGGWLYITPVDGVTAYVRSVGLWAAFRSGAWEMGALRGSALLIGDSQVVGARDAAIGAPAGGSIVDAEARTAINQILASHAAARANRNVKNRVAAKV